MRPNQLTAKLATIALVAALGVGTATAASSASSNAASSSATHFSATAATTGTTASAGAGGNLVVVVPPVPNHQALFGLCTAFLAGGDHQKSSPPFQVLMGATGGRVSTTTSWCQHFLTLAHSKH